MKQDYYGTKRITAWPSVKEDKQGDALQEGYAVMYADGYLSWSPKDVFEASYQPITEMSFSHALSALKEGYRVSCFRWNNTGEWIYRVPGAIDLQDVEGGTFIEDEGGYSIRMLPSHDVKRLSPWIGQKTNDGSFVPWTPSQIDMDANDWYIIEEGVYTGYSSFGE